MSPSFSNTEMFYQFYDRSVPVIEFESWIYENVNLEDHLGADDYLELISINFRHPRAWQDIHKVLERHVDIRNYVKWRLGRILRNIINRTDNVHRDIEETYHIYCDGYVFMRKLGLRYGLTVCHTPNQYSASHFDDLKPQEQQMFIDSMYPGIIRHANRVLDCLDNNKIEFVDFENKNLEAGFPKQPDYLDRRSRREKKVMSLKTIKLDNPFVSFLWHRLKIPIYTYD